MSTPLARIATLAADLAAEAGEHVRGAFGTWLEATSKTTPADVVTELDRAAESLITTGILAAFPDHTVISEEAGVVARGDRPWTWHVDPLDGSHNVALGIPNYGVAIVVTENDTPRVAVVRDSHLQRQVVAEGGTLRTPLQRSTPPSVTVALQQGYGVARDDLALAHVREQLERGHPRVLYTWSPSVDLHLLLRGAIGGVVAFRCAGPEHVAARHVADVAGLDVEVVEDTGAHATYVVAWPEVTAGLIASVASGVRG